MKKLLMALLAAGGIALAASSSASGQLPICPPGQSTGPYCQAPPGPCANAKFTAKMSLLRATFTRNPPLLSILAPISSRASGDVNILLQAAGRSTRFTAPIDNEAGRILHEQDIPAAQARKGQGILNISYPGDADTRPQEVRLRAANNPSNLTVERPTIVDGALRARGRVSAQARGVVRVQLEYIDRASGQTVTLQRNARIGGGRWALNSPLSAAVLAQIANRCGTVHSYTLFTGYIQLNMRGEMRSLEVLPHLN